MAVTDRITKKDFKRAMESPTVSWLELATKRSAEADSDWRRDPATFVSVESSWKSAITTSVPVVPTSGLIVPKSEEWGTW